MKTAKELAHQLCKQFRRHDDDASENLIAEMLERFAKDNRVNEKLAAVKRFKAVKTFGMSFNDEARIEDAIIEAKGWLNGLGGQ
jgi:hypothetical protein